MGLPHPIWLSSSRRKGFFSGHPSLRRKFRKPTIFNKASGLSINQNIQKLISHCHGQLRLHTGILMDAGLRGGPGPCHSCSVSFSAHTPHVPPVYLQFSSVQSLSRVRLFATPWITARQASLSITNSQSSLRLTPSSRWCHPAISSSVYLQECYLGRDNLFQGPSRWQYAHCRVPCQVPHSSGSSGLEASHLALSPLWGSSIWSSSPLC